MFELYRPRGSTSPRACSCSKNQLINLLQHLILQVFLDKFDKYLKFQKFNKICDMKISFRIAESLKYTILHALQSRHLGWSPAGGIFIETYWVWITSRCNIRTDYAGSNRLSRKEQSRIIRSHWRCHLSSPHRWGSSWISRIF